MANLPIISQPLKDATNSQSNSLINKVAENCHRNLVSKYSNQREYFHMELMNVILHDEKSQENDDFHLSPQTRIKTLDLKFNDEYQYLSKYYKDCASTIQMVELCDYYKYYLQDPLTMMPGLFKIMYCYNQKKKKQFIKKLRKFSIFNRQKVLTLVIHFFRIMIKISKKKSLNNILAGISLSRFSDREKDQSECFVDLQDKLVKAFGKQSETNLNEIDKIYNFKKKNDSSKIATRMIKTFHLTKGLKNSSNSNNVMKKTILESTNSSNSNLHSSVYMPGCKVYPLKKQKYQFEKSLKHFSIIDNKINEQKLDKLLFRKMKNPYRNSSQQTIRANIQLKADRGKRKIRRRSCDMPFKQLELKIFEKTLTKKTCPTQLRCKDYNLKKDNYLKMYLNGTENKRTLLNSCEKLKKFKSEEDSIEIQNYEKQNECKEKKIINLRRNRQSTQFITNKQDIRKHIDICKQKIRQQVKKILKTEHNVFQDQRKSRYNEYEYDEQNKNKQNQLYRKMIKKKQEIYLSTNKNLKIKKTTESARKSKIS